MAGVRGCTHPEVQSDLDRGSTNIDLQSGKQQRLDYHCFSMPGVPSTGAVAHHMFIRLRDQSDHFALEAVIERWSPHCTPSEAIELESIPPFPTSTGDPTSLRMVDVNFLELDAYQWIHVNKPGTYTIHRPPALTTRLFLDTDLSNAISPVDTLAITDLPPAAQAAFSEVPVDRKGTTFAARRPFFIAVQTTAVDPGPAKLSVFEHLGDTPATAIWLTPHVSTPSSFPAGQPLGIDDLCWFKAQLPLTFGGLHRTEKFTFSNDTGTEIEVTEFDTALQQLDSVSGPQTSLDLNVDTTGGEQRLFLIRRSSETKSDIHASGFPRSRTLRSIDRSDSMSATNQVPTGLATTRSSLTYWWTAHRCSRGVGIRPIPASAGPVWSKRFAIASRRSCRGWTAPITDIITLSYIEHDISAGGWLVQFFTPLAPSDSEQCQSPVELADSRFDLRRSLYLLLLDQSFPGMRVHFHRLGCEQLMEFHDEG